MQQISGEQPCRSTISTKLQNNLIEIALPHGCSAAKLLHIFRTPFYKNTPGWLLLIYFILKVLLHKAEKDIIKFPKLQDIFQFINHRLIWTTNNYLLKIVHSSGMQLKGKLRVWLFGLFTRFLLNILLHFFNWNSKHQRHEKQKFI